MSDLKIEHLNVEYTMKRTQHRVLAIRDVSFAVHSGEFVAIVGPSGCGKTTILNAIAGLLAERSGRITSSGREIGGPGRDRAMVFQEPALLPWRTVKRNVAYGLELQGREPPETRILAQRYIELVGLQGFEESYPNELSGGMQQRANLARALAVQPEVLLFDEPLAALDAQTRELMQMELQRIWLQDQTTSVYVTHMISEAIFLADRVIVMTPSPGTIKSVVPVDLPRPRPLHVQRTLPFIRLEAQIWDLLEPAGGLREPTTPRG
jgi:NitT/TauT family transport system ATP-binding protein